MTLNYLFFSLFFTVPATTYIYTLSLHDALPILLLVRRGQGGHERVFRTSTVANGRAFAHLPALEPLTKDRKSTRLNSSHITISYAVFCLKKKKIKTII